MSILRSLDFDENDKRFMNRLFCQNKLKRVMKRLFFLLENLYVAEGGFDPPTSGLWAQHASSAPLC